MVLRLRLFHFDDSFPTSGKTHPLTRPILKKAKSEPEPAVVPLPYYFFGDGSEVSPVPDLKPEEGNVWRGSRRDFSGTSFYRTTVEFKTEIKKQDKKRKTGVSITKQTPLVSLEWKNARTKTDFEKKLDINISFSIRNSL